MYQEWAKNFLLFTAVKKGIITRAARITSSKYPKKGSFLNLVGNKKTTINFVVFFYLFLIFSSHQNNSRFAAFHMV